MIHCLLYASSGKERGGKGPPNTVIRKTVRLYNLQIHLFMTLHRCNMFPHALLTISNANFQEHLYMILTIQIPLLTSVLLCKNVFNPGFFVFNISNCSSL